MPITIYKGNHTSYDISIYDRYNLPMDITTAPISFTVFPYKEETGTVLFTRANTLASGGASEIEMVYPTSGLCRLHLIPENTVPLTFQSYWYKLEATIGSKIYTLSQDAFTVM